MLDGTEIDLPPAPVAAVEPGRPPEKFGIVVRLAKGPGIGLVPDAPK